MPREGLELKMNRIVRIGFVVALSGVCLGLPSTSEAGRKKARECKASAPPSSFEQDGEVGDLASLVFADQSWGVRLDRPDRPKSIRLLSLAGDAIDLSKPPPTRPVHWVSRGRSVYAVGTGKSRVEGKVDVLVLRWSDPGRRPQLIKLWTADAVTDGPVAEIVDETLAVAWGERIDATNSRLAVGFVNLERTNIGERKLLGEPGPRVRARLLALPKGFVAVGSASGKPSGVLARYDAYGRPQGEPETLSLPEKREILSAMMCENELYAVVGKEDDAKPALMRHDGGKGLKQIKRFERVLDPAELQLSCAGDSAVVGFRTWNDKVGTITFWLSTVGPNGTSKERRIKDMKGTPEDLTSVRLSGGDDTLSAWWVQKDSGRASLFGRALACE